MPRTAPLDGQVHAWPRIVGWGSAHKEPPATRVRRAIQ